MACIVRVSKVSKKEKKRHPSARYKVVKKASKRASPRTLLWTKKKKTAKTKARNVRKNC